MARVVISPLAQADLEKITDDIIANNGQLVAERTLANFDRAFKVLATHPHVGRDRSRLGKGVLSWPITVDLALYRPNSDGIDLAPLLHGRRRITRKLVASER
jgi:toxin ParE1/3/4